MTEEFAPTLQAQNNGSTAVPAVLAFHHKQDPDAHPYSPSLGTTSDGMGVLAFSAKDSGADCAHELAPTLRAGTHDASHENGGVMPAIVAYDTTQITHPENRCNPRAGDPCHPLAAAGHAPLVVPIQEVGKRTGTSTTDPRAGIGIGNDGDPMYTLQASAQHGVVCTTGEVTHALTHEGHDASEDGTGRGTPIVAEHVPSVSGTIKGKTGVLCVGRESEDDLTVTTAGIPRRLMPIECERLMSWPDGWTDVPDEKGKPASDAARYKACGNGVVSNVAQWIGERLASAHAVMTSNLVKPHV